jgi:hypothetical protein
VLRGLLRAAYRAPGARADEVLALPGARRLLIGAAIDPAAPAAAITADQWHQLAITLADQRRGLAGPHPQLPRLTP